MKISRNLFRPLPIALAAVLSFSSAVQAQSLIDLYEIARGYDASFISAKAQYEANLAKANQTLGGILPNISMTTSATRTNISVTADATATTTENRYGVYSANVTMTQPIYRPAVWATYKQGGRQLLQATAQYEAAEQELLVRVTQTYFDVLSSQDSLEFVKAQKKAVAEQLASAKRNFEVGTATITGVRDAQARYDLTYAQEIAAENDLRIKTLSLGLAVGRTDIKAKPLRDNSKLIDPPKDPMDSWVSQSEVMSPTVRQAQLALDVAKLEVDKAVAGHLPTLDGQIVYGGTRNYGGTSTSPTTPTASNHVLNPSANIVLSIPLFAGLTTQYRIRETKALEEKAISDLDNAKRTVAQTTRTAYLGLIAGLSQVKAYEAAEASTQSALDANKLGYSVGVNINIDVLNSQSQLYQTKRDLAKARYDVLVGNLKLRQAAGTLTPQDLQEINQLLAP
ncbi:MAG: channel protein TolC [Betaproteobacteria bacterium]|nr:channel protein TolC [Betaproteobacteria bacterium]